MSNLWGYMRGWIFAIIPSSILDEMIFADRNLQATFNFHLLLINDMKVMICIIFD